MTLIKLPAHKAGLFISHNEHRYSATASESTSMKDGFCRSNTADEPRPLGAVGSSRLLGAEPSTNENK